MMLFHTGKLRLLAVATTMLASMSFISAASAAGPTYALVQINQQALFFNLMNKGAQDAAKASGKDLVIFNSNDNPVAQNDAIENYIHGAFASLELAQHFVEQNDLPNAEKQLQQGLAAASDDNLKSVISMRLARVQLQMKQADAALKTLDSIKGEGWTAIVADLRGEILLSKGDKQGARAAWEAGVKSDASPALSEMMRMKMNNLSI